MRSKKKIKNPKDYLLPYEVTFPVDVTVTINNKVSFFRANEKAGLNIGEYESILNTSEYGHYLK